MITLVLLRHAKAVVASAAGDHARGLSPRGIAEAAEAGAAIAAAGVPDFALVSDARRTRETFERIVVAAGQPIDHRFEPKLYGAAPDAILARVGEAPQACRRLLVVGHNPGLGDLARQLVGAAEVPDAMAAHFPTAAFAAIEFSGQRWTKARRGGRLAVFLPPRAWREDHG